MISEIPMMRQFDPIILCCRIRPFVLAGLLAILTTAPLPLWSQFPRPTAHLTGLAKSVVKTECDPIELYADRSLGKKQSRDYAILCRDTLTDLDRKWKVEPCTAQVLVYIAPTSEDYTKTGGDPNSSGGFTTVRKCAVAWGWSYAVPIAVINGDSDPDFIPTALRHEMAHVAAIVADGTREEAMPIWFQEGIATLHQYGGAQVAELAEGQANDDQKVPSIPKIQSGCDTEGADPVRMRIYAADLIAYSERRFGSDWVGRVLPNIRGGMDFDSAFSAASKGLTPNTLADQWRKDLDERARQRAIRDNEQVVGVLLAITAVIGGITLLVGRATRGRALGTIVDQTPDGRKHYTTDDRQPLYMGAKIAGVESMMDADQTKRRETMRQYAQQAIDGTINWPAFYSAWSGVAIADPIQRTTYWNLLDLHEKSPGFPFKPGINYKHRDTKKMVAGLRLDAALLGYDLDPADLEQIRAECINVPEDAIESEVARRVTERADRIHPHEDGGR